ncbi:MAG: CRISPR-associated endonuclease Cas1 [Phycisphaerales bacterium]|nr:CRISPR-associated endonuclease Cas1 [Phycisphaerales bacterium]
MTEFSSALRVLRVRFLLEATAEIQLATHQGAAVYATLAAAHGRATGQSPAMPDGIMPDAPEQCRSRLVAGDQYSMGCTILEEEPGRASSLVATLAAGLRKMGSDRTLRRSGASLAGNFRVSEVRDLVAGIPLANLAQPAPISRDRFERERTHARAQPTLTLVFTSPLRMPRPAAACTEGHTWFDESHFSAGLFAVRVMSRLESLGLGSKPEDVRWVYRACRLLENRLVWLDVGYGPASRRKTLGGGVGRVTVECTDGAVADALVMGQYVRAGQSTRFGFGAYRIAELGPAPDACERAIPLLSALLQRQNVARVCDELDLPSGALRRAMKDLQAGTYRPGAHARVPIQQPGGKARVLSIPSPLDRALQRAILRRLAPALDQFFEESSLAYRHGLGRHRAAARVQAAFQKGYRFALKSDFTAFFDSIPHHVLEDRLHAYLADAPAVSALMAWVKAGSPFEDRGVPTGSPLSPLLANLFLDFFDEEVSRDGGVLVRYADDFLILFKDQAQARRVYAQAEDAAQTLLLSLNQRKTGMVDLTSPFVFLGFEFRRSDQWRMIPTDAPREAHELGWRQAPPPTPRAIALPLPGETVAASAESRSWAVFGPGASVLRVRDGRLSCSYANGSPDTAVEFDHVREVLVLGGATATGQALRELAARNIRLILADDSGRPVAELGTHGADEQPEAVAAQLRMTADEPRRTEIARRLIAAKIANYAALAAAVEQGDDRTAAALRSFQNRALAAPSPDTLRGVEGAAARRWYALVRARTPHWCRFDRRVAPDADDPVNILLNIAHTTLHRQAILAVRMAGLLPGVGALHEARAGHASLASDLQEPFRHLMDRAVLAILPALKPTDFRPTPDGPFRVGIRPEAARHAVACIHDALARPCTAAGKPDAHTYLTHLLSSARQLRRHLLDPAVAFEPFVHPAGASQPAEEGAAAEIDPPPREGGTP